MKTKESMSLFLGIILGFVLGCVFTVISYSLAANAEKNEIVELEKEKLRLEIQLKKKQLKL